jgi:hypothetical protein
VDLARDPDESVDVAAAHEDVVRRHMERMEQLSGELTGEPASDPEPDDGDRERLRALGYGE